MNIFVYDKTFEGLLTCVFDAYSRRVFPDILLGEDEVPPLFYDEKLAVVAEEEKAGRVWKGLEKKISRSALSMLTTCWLSELPEVDILLFRYIRKAIDATRPIETDFSDPDVLELSKIWKKVNWERIRIMQFVRFQKAEDGTFFAAIEPIHNALPLAIEHFKDRFSDQKWIIYDIKRKYGYYYDLKEVTEVTFDSRESHLITGMLDETLMANDEKLFRRMWKAYFKSIAIKERTNPKLHKRNMPVRYWKYLTEKQE